MLKSNFKKILKQFKKDVVDVEISKKLEGINVEGKLDNTFIEHPNRIMVTDRNGKVVPKNVSQSQLDYIVGLSSDAQAQLNNKSDKGHTHNQYATKDELNVVAGKDAEGIGFNAVASHLQSTNVREAIEEVNSKLDDEIHIQSTNKRDTDIKISELNSTVSYIDSDYLSKSKVGTSVAPLENGKLPIKNLPDHVHTDFVPHSHDEFNSFALKEDLSNTNKMLRDHNHNDDYAKISHTHQDILDRIEQANVEQELATLDQKIADNKGNISKNASEIANLKRDKANEGHSHEEFKSLQSQIDEIELVATEHTHTQYETGLVDVNSRINQLSNVYAPKTHNHNSENDNRYAQRDHEHDFTQVAESILPSLDNKYAPKTHTHGQYADSNHNHDERYAPISVVVDIENLADKNHKHPEYAPQVHQHAEFTSLASDISTKANSEDVYTKTQIDEKIATINTSAATKDEVATGLEGKADLEHTHSFESLTNVPSEFNPVAHIHKTDDIEGLLDLIKANAGGGGTADSIRYPQINLEEGLTIECDTFPYGDIRRYGGKTEEEDINFDNAKIFTSIVNSNLGYVYFPKGTWNLTLVGTKTILDNEFRLLGEDKEKTIIKTGYDSSNYIIVKDACIKDLTFAKPNKKNYAYYTLYINSELTKIELENVKFSGSYYAIYCLAASSIEKGVFKNVEFSRGGITGSTYGITKYKCAAGTRHIFENVITEDIIQPIEITNVNTNSGVFLLFDKCSFLNAGTHSIRLEGGHPTNQYIIKDCVFKNNTYSVFTVATSSGSFESLLKIENCLFSTNSTSSSSAGLYLRGSRRSIVSNCSFNGYVSGIDATNTVATGNYYNVISLYNSFINVTNKYSSSATKVKTFDFTNSTF